MCHSPLTCVQTAVFLHLFCSFITFMSYYSKTAFLDCLRESFVLTVWWTKLANRQLLLHVKYRLSYRIVTGLDHASHFLVFFHLNFLFDST